MLRWVLRGGVFVGAVACGGSGFFVCNDDGDCMGAAEGEAGVCQPTGACSVPDESCASGQRYVEGSAPSVAGECVGDEGMTGGQEGSTTQGDPSADDTAGPGGCPPDWWDCSWAHRQRLQLSRSVEPMTDVPVLLLLTEGRVDHGRMQSDGEDLRVVSASGALAPYEIERWAPEDPEAPEEPGVSVVWATVDVLGGADDHLWIYYGNPVAESAEDREGTWPEPFVGVWHLEDDDPVDATAHANDAMLSGDVGNASAQIGNGSDLHTSGTALLVEASPSLADVFTSGGTFSAWFRARDWGGGDLGRFAEKGGPGVGWLIYLGDDGALRFLFKLDPETNLSWVTTPEQLSLLRWTHVAITYEALGPSIPRVFVDGVERPLADPAAQPELLPETIPTDLDVPLILGNRPEGDRRFDGVLDEIRLEQVVRSPEWIGVQHDSMRDDLLEYGSIESWEGSP